MLVHEAVTEKESKVKELGFGPRQEGRKKYAQKGKPVPGKGQKASSGDLTGCLG